MMKVLILSGLLLAGILFFANRTDGLKKSDVHKEVGQTESALRVVVIAPKRRYRSRDKIMLPVMLLNSGKEDIYVFGTLGWGYSSSFILQVRDALGREIQPAGSPDDQTHFSRNDNTVFVKLLPNHFLGTNFFAPLTILNLDRPGRYTLWVEYHCPISTADVGVKPFWGKESGTIKSNVIQIEVLP
jgi:hypothetical protein